MRKEVDDKLDKKADSRRVDQLESDLKEDISNVQKHMSEKVSIQLENIITLLNKQDENFKELKQSQADLNNRLNDHISKGK